MKIVIGCDHAGFTLKTKIIEHLNELAKENNIEITDVGTYSPDRCDYPVLADKLCKKIQSNECQLGILICGTGVGMSIAANKHKGIRAACCSDIYSAKLTRMHNDANVLCFGERVVGVGLATELVDGFIFAEFEGGKHKERVDMINSFEK